MLRNGSTRGNHVIRPCLLAAVLVGSLFALRISAQTVDSYRQRAAELSRTKSWDDAITNYRKSLELEPNDAATHYNLALALKYKGESREALKEFQAALKRIASVCAGSPVAPGIHFGDTKRLTACREMGYRFLVYSTDMSLMLSALRDGLGNLRKAAAGAHTQQTQSVY